MAERNRAEDKFTIDRLFKRAYTYANSAEYIKFIDFIAKFNHYSRYNTMLVYMQNRAVTFFGGESYWKKKFNRIIKEDARPYIILAPGGPVMLAYDIFDTEGEQTVDELLKEGLNQNHHEVTGFISTRYFDEIIEEVKRWQIILRFRPLSYFNGGFVTTIISGRLEISLKKELSASEQFRVLIHELAHLFLGHTGHKELQLIGTDKKHKLLQRKLSRNAQELEAETVAYLILKRLDFESKSAEYIAGYIDDDELLLHINYEIIIKTADKIEALFLRHFKTNNTQEYETRLKIAREKAQVLRGKQGSLFDLEN